MVFVLKLAGSLFVLCAAVYYGKNINETYDNRLIQLRHLYSMLLQLKSEMSYMNETLPDCFFQLGKNAKEPLKQWLQQLSTDLEHQEDTSFSIVWRNNLQNLGKISDLKSEDILLLEELADKLGTTDGKSQMKAIDYVLLQLERNRTCLQQEIKDKKKVVTTITLFVGFVTLIILL